MIKTTSSKQFWETYPNRDSFRQRYMVRDAWLERGLNFDGYREKDLLEIGYGDGLDMLRFANGGAHVHGIDLSQEHYLLTKRTLDFFQFKPDLRVGDAAYLPWKDNRFDFIYSIGVLHHIENPLPVLREVERVLKPGGRCTFAVYSLWSKFFFVDKLLKHGILEGQLFRVGWTGNLSTIERGADGRILVPYVKLYTTRILKRLFKKSGLIVDRIWKPQGKFGWYIVVDARAPEGPKGGRE